MSNAKLKNVGKRFICYEEHMEEMGGGWKTEEEACLYLPGVHLPAIP